MSAIARAMWPLALLVLFLGTFRRTGHDSSSQHRAVECNESGRPATADTALLEHCVSVDPTDVARLADLGDTYASRGRGDLAEDAYRRALVVDPRDGDVHARLGELLLKRGDRPGAHAEAELALRWHHASARAVSLAERSAASAAMVNDQ